MASPRPSRSRPSTRSQSSTPSPPSTPSQSSVQSKSSTRQLEPLSPTANVLLFLIAFRLLNAFVVRTFFQPDEFFQSLEPAWQIAFGNDQGAWLTWEWRHQLRSSLHPLFFAALYQGANLLASALRLTTATRAELLIAAPKVAQGVISAIGDFYTWKLALRIYGKDSRGAWATLAATVLNPWQWFCSTRTLSNCLETTITIVALELWPWQWSAGPESANSRAQDVSTARRGTDADRSILRNLRQCLSLAAVACILRPTNILIWATLASVVWFRTSWAQRKVLFREVILCGLSVLAVSAGVDRLFYGFWTFPPVRFLYFNIAQSLAVFYGHNDWHYYLTQGYPLLLTTLIYSALVGIYRTLTTREASAVDRVQTSIRVQLATVCLVMPFALSLISHKEVRFIYPLLPSLHILAAPHLVQSFWSVIYRETLVSDTPRRLTLIFLVLVNVVIALYTTVWHASGPLNVLSYLRQRHEAHVSLPKPEGWSTAFTQSSAVPATGITAGFLMPCHSTPWRSHLIYPSIHAWALSCEPPIDLNEAQKAVYRDEADQFYDDPNQFLRENMAGGLRHLPRRPSYSSGAQALSGTETTTNTPTQHEWPDYLIFFAQLEPTLHNLLRSSSYAECWRTWNTAWHDDWRRRGDIIVWCLDPAEQDAWRSETYRRERESRDRQFDRIVEAIKNEANGPRKKHGWKAFIPSSWPWSSSPSTFASWKRSARSLFAGSSSSPAWPWAPRSRSATFWEKFHLPVRRGNWIPSWPAWLGGKSKKSKTPLNRDLWS
ncbi:hypothetical protein NUU61_005290 [Penicillium alfredii]|uniref:Mannosyltransferase n=1 Tax=Penicillium alfredii TaxID=1506179 RepID=A0A9W9F9A3_9EURO|nr:uncharacterized protein NUU61_005290 [Penicillium alfredii]KAJ5095934.1 hypothetical protein NUU61_005290 [Penicillium alfredii]